LKTDKSFIFINSDTGQLPTKYQSYVVMSWTQVQMESLNFNRMIDFDIVNMKSTTSGD